MKASLVVAGGARFRHTRDGAHSRHTRGFYQRELGRQQHPRTVAAHALQSPECIRGVSHPPVSENRFLRPHRWSGGMGVAAMGPDSGRWLPCRNSRRRVSIPGPRPSARYWLFAFRRCLKRMRPGGGLGVRREGGSGGGEEHVCRG